MRHNSFITKPTPFPNPYKYFQPFHIRILSPLKHTKIMEEIKWCGEKCEIQEGICSGLLTGTSQHTFTTLH